MTGYEKRMYEQDIPGIRKALERIATVLESINNDSKGVYIKQIKTNQKWD